MSIDSAAVISAHDRLIRKPDAPREVARELTDTSELGSLIAFRTLTTNSTSTLSFHQHDKDDTMKDAMTASVTLLILLWMKTILSLSKPASAYACCYVGCPAKHPNCQAW